jgi:hypothetical protein
LCEQQWVAGASWKCAVDAAGGQKALRLLTVYWDLPPLPLRPLQAAHLAAAVAPVTPLTMTAAAAAAVAVFAAGEAALAGQVL